MTTLLLFLPCLLFQFQGIQAPAGSSRHSAETANTDFEAAVLTLSGASCLEELSESELEHYQSLSEHPINLNLSSEGRLRSSGLLSAYQIASLLDYRRSNGAVLSYLELSLVSGFPEQFTRALRLFTTLSANSPIASRPSSRFSQSASISGAARLREGAAQYSAKLKYSASYAERLSLLYSNRNTYSSPAWGVGTISAAYYGRGALSKLLLGNFSARFGQGMLEWSGFSLSSFSSLASFSRNPSGLSSTSAADSPLLGAAAELLLGSYALCAGYSFPNASYFARLSRDWRNLSVSVNASSAGISFDWRHSREKLSIFSEAAYLYQGKLAAMAGAVYTPEYGRSFALRAHYYPASEKKYSGIALGADIPALFASLEGGYRRDQKLSQYKSLLILRGAASNMAISLRWSERYRPKDSCPLRSDLRLDLSSKPGNWVFAARANLLYCKSFSQLYYLQSGYKTDKFSVNLTLTYYNVPNWEDRIYAYNQDIPGSFNIPAYNGRGLSASLYSALHLGSRHSLYLRLEYGTRTTEAKLQYRIKI